MQDRVWQIERYSWIIHLNAMNVSWSFIIQLCYSICNILKSPWKYQQNFWVQQVVFFMWKKRKNKKPKTQNRIECQKERNQGLCSYLVISRSFQILKYILKPLSLKDCTIAQWMERWNNGEKIESSGEEKPKYI